MPAGLLTEEQARRVWEEQGLEGHMRRMHELLLSHGLQPMAIPDYVFLENFWQKVMINFLVKGVIEDEHGRQNFPTDGD